MARATRRQGGGHQRQRRSRRVRTAQLEQLNLNAAGIDVGADAHWVAVPPDRDAQPVHSLGRLRPISMPWPSGDGSVRLTRW